MTAVVCDLHSDMLSDPWLREAEPVDLVMSPHWDELRRAGVNLRWATVGGDFVPLMPRFTPSTLATTLEMLGILREAAAAVDDVQIVASPSSLKTALSAGSIALLPTVEGGGVLHGRIRVLDELFRLGVRSLTLTHRHRNELADGNADESTNSGLTAFGRQVVASMERLQMIIDISHLTGRAIADVFEVANGPVVASHSNARALCDHPRNLTDSQLRAVADSGGLVGIAFCAPYLTPEPGGATVDDIVRHIEHIAELIGVERVGLGPDVIDYLPQGPDLRIDYPPGAETAAGIPAVIARLRERGWDEADVAWIAGESAHRFLLQALPEDS
jgi:membrane dipeptidase